MNDLTQLERAGLFLARAPRYTSYPTAPQFDGRVGGDIFSSWLRAVPEGSAISLYVHIPFCRRLCWFCACRTQGTQSDDPVLAYLDTLIEEIDLVRQQMGQGIRVSRVHWGGGTPTILSPESIANLSNAIFSRFERTDETEFSVEIDPNELDEARVSALAAAGMNRASLGVQDFDPMIQLAIGREQGADITLSAAEAVRTHGIRSVNVDLVYGLPHQTQARMTSTLTKLRQIRPDRIALYGYAHVPWMAKRQVMIPEDALPNSHERLDLFNLAREILVSDGYVPIGIDHFALPEDGLAQAAKAGTLKRNFQGYTDDQADILVGLGASSISRFEQGYAQNSAATAQYLKAIRANRFATGRGFAFAAQDILRGAVIERIMCDFAFDLDSFGAHAPELLEEVRLIAETCAADWPELVSFDGVRFAIRPNARPLARMVAQKFDAFNVASANFSQAV